MEQNQRHDESSGGLAMRKRRSVVAVCLLLTGTGLIVLSSLLTAREYHSSYARTPIYPDWFVNADTWWLHKMFVAGMVFQFVSPLFTSWRWSLKAVSCACAVALSFGILLLSAWLSWEFFGRLPQC